MPWRAHTAEAALRGGPATTEAFGAAADAELAAAQPTGQSSPLFEFAEQTAEQTRHLYGAEYQSDAPACPARRTDPAVDAGAR